MAALAGVRAEVTYEAQAAIELEMLSRAGADPYPWGVDEASRAGVARGDRGRVDRRSRRLSSRLAPLFAAVLDDLERGRGRRGRQRACTRPSRRWSSTSAAGFARPTGPPTVALSGGVFQNRLVSDLCETGLEAAGFGVLTHALVPANDGGRRLGRRRWLAIL